MADFAAGRRAAGGAGALMKIVIFGGGGFIGRHLARRLSARGHHLIIPTRDREKAKELFVLPATDIVAYDPGAWQGVLPLLEGADAVINLAGILNERSGGEFVRVHNEFVRVLCDRCVAKKVRRLVHISALNAVGAAPSEYLRSKAKAEQIVRGATLRHVIVRPSVVFGRGDSFVTLFVRLAKILPVLFLPCAYSVLQPIAADDLTAMIVHAAETGDEDGKILSAGGPQKLTLAEIVRAALDAAGVRRPVVELGPALSFAAGAIMEAIPGVHLFSRDNCLSANLHSVTTGGNDAERILGRLTSLRAGLAEMYDSGGAGLRAHLRR
ncbi:MAG: NAD(P)H-binding protein [Gammaproteobacteria bacterium]